MKAIVLPFLLSLAVLGQSGCLSMAVMQRATSPRYRFARMTAIEGATLVARDVFVQASVLRPDSVEPEPVVIKIATSEKYWAQSHSTPAASYMSGLLLAHVPTATLLTSAVLPSGGADLPIESIEIRSLDELKSLNALAPRGIRVLSVRYRPDVNDVPLHGDRLSGVPPAGDTLLAIVSPARSDEPGVILISDFQDGYTTRRAWLVALPFAAAADAVALPFEFLGGLAEAE